MVTGRLSFQSSNDVKLKMLFCLIAPPTVPPYIFSLVPRSTEVSWPGAIVIVGSLIEFMLGSRHEHVAPSRAACWCPTSCSG